MAKGRPAAQLLQYLAVKIAADAESKLGIDARKAEDFGYRIAADVALDWGGQSMYIPMDAASSIANRNAEIYKKFNGQNEYDLAAEYGTSVRHINRIIKQELELRQPKRGSLFD